ncbi:importin subunit alpha-like isoform X1 [Contarinia nasturtii]|uniref:importin subunit alpha-like isoform X1 n=1 Tax=Contarinia nasturtii TaxID=265458 RepID=UPI0012D44938|nr:importin subunit alpha-like isoform X1 [Contarinia nasturtii]
MEIVRKTPKMARSSSKRRNMSEIRYIDVYLDTDGLYPSFEKIIADMRGNDAELVYQATRATRIILDATDKSAIYDITDRGVIPICLGFLDSDSSTLQYEAASILTIIARAASDKISRGIPKFVELLKSTSVNVSEQSAVVLKIIGGNGLYMRDEIFKHNIAEVISEILQYQQPTSFLRKIINLISSLLHYKNPAPIDKMKMMIMELEHFLNYDEAEILSDTVLAIQIVTAHDSNCIQAVIDAGCVSILVQLLDDSDCSVAGPAIQSIANIAKGTEAQIDAIVDAGCVPTLVQLLNVLDSSITEPAIQSIANIARGTEAQIDVIINAGVIKYMPQLLKNSSQNVVVATLEAIENVCAGKQSQIEHVIQEGIFNNIRDLLCSDIKILHEKAASVVTNFFLHGSQKQIIHLIKEVNILPPLCELMKTANDHSPILLTILPGLNQMWSKLIDNCSQESWYLYTDIFVNAEGIEILRSLQENGCDRIKDQAKQILDEYFPIENEESGEDWELAIIEIQNRLAALENAILFITGHVKPRKRNIGQ